MKSLALIIAGCLGLASSTAAQDVGWRDRHGNPVPESDAQKSKDGFGGWLLITDDPEWEAKWNTPQHVAPNYRQAETVGVGQTIVALIFISNPAKDAAGNVNVTCDLRLDRPDGTHSHSQTGVPCMVGHLPGDPLSIFLADPVVGFLGEPSDPVGEWTFFVTLNDTNRPTRIELKASFTYVNDG